MQFFSRMTPSHADLQLAALLARIEFPVDDLAELVATLEALAPQAVPETSGFFAIGSRAPRVSVPRAATG
jgi:hypothetical protein